MLNVKMLKNRQKQADGWTSSIHKLELFKQSSKELRGIGQPQVTQALLSKNSQVIGIEEKQQYVHKHYKIISMAWFSLSCEVWQQRAKWGVGVKGFLMLLDKDADGKNRFQITPTKYEI